jgi:hypothetical protein
MVGRKQWKFWYVSLLILVRYDEDLDLFDRIVLFRDNGKPKSEAELFYLEASHSANSLIDIVYDLENIDYVLVFPKELSPTSSLHDGRTVEDRATEHEDFLLELLDQGLFLNLDELDDTSCYANIVVPFHALCVMAEKQNIKLTLKKVIHQIDPSLMEGINEPTGVQSYLGFKDPVNLNHLTAAFSIKDQHLFRESHDKENFFFPFHKAFLVYNCSLIS